MPVMNVSGKKTTTVVMVAISTGTETSLALSRAAVRGSLPMCRWRTVFSTSTILEPGEEGLDVVDHGNGAGPGLPEQRQVNGAAAIDMDDVGPPARGVDHIGHVPQVDDATAVGPERDLLEHLGIGDHAVRRH